MIHLINLINLIHLTTHYMYEHAYMIDYGTDKASYIDRFITHIPWGAVEKRAASVLR